MVYVYLLETFVLVTSQVVFATFFQQGVEIAMLDISELSDDDRCSMLGQYNAYLGSISSILSILFQQLPSMLMSIFFPVLA